MPVNQRYVPSAPLAAFVESFWLYECGEPVHRRERRLPDGTASLIINLRDDLIRIYDRRAPDRFQSCRGSVINGAHSEFMLIDTACQEEIMGVQFRPGGAAPFFALPASELHNRTISLDLLWGEAAGDLRARLVEARTLEQRFLILERFLLAQLVRQARSIHPAITYALKTFHGNSYSHSMRALIDEIGVGQTRFIQLFRETVGLTPKQYCRVRRFQSVLGAARRNEAVGWTRLALNVGYYDQAHLIHDFHDFAGLTPGAYLALQGEHRNHVPLTD